MFNVNRKSPPVYENNRSLEENFKRFFDWGLHLRNPIHEISDRADELGFGVRRHPIGFTVIYLSQKDEGRIRNPALSGLVRANIYPVGVEIKDDIHSHGFDFFSGVIQGALTNRLYTPDWTQPAIEGNGLVGYEGRSNHEGKNITIEATSPIAVPQCTNEQELEQGATYTMKSRDSFHAIEVKPNVGTVTIFCKTPTYTGSDGLSLTLRAVDQPAVDIEY